MKIIPLLTAGAVWDKVWPVLIAILLFGVIIFLHELGHFVFAKLFKVQVNEFAMGMGPAIFKFKKGETQYALRLLPFGGFVSMEGEDENSENERAFCNAKAWKRFIIIAAGVTMNIITGVVIFAFLLSQKELIGTPQIHSFEETSVTSQAGFQPLDTIKEINGKAVFSEYDMSYLMSRDKDGALDFVVERNGEKVAINGVKFKTVDHNGTPVMMYDFIIVGVEPTFINVLKNSLLESVSVARIVWLSLFDLVTGQVSMKEVSGPIGTVNLIAQAAQTSTQQTDYTYLFTMMGLLTVNLGVFNLLPIPALDGGRLFFLLIEIIFRKPIPRKYEGWVHTVGIILLLMFMVVISFKDIITLIKG